MLCSCREPLLREGGCAVHGPWVPSAFERLIACDWPGLPWVDTVMADGSHVFRTYGLLDRSDLGLEEPLVFRRYEHLPMSTGVVQTPVEGV